MALRVLSVLLPVLLIFTVAVNTARRREYPQQRDAASANVASRGRSGALLRTTPSPKGIWTARNHGTARIYDGEQAEVGQFPHQALITAFPGGASFTGSLISRRAVLTHANTVYSYQNWTIRLGGIHRTKDEETAWTTVSTWALIHPDYNKNKYYAALAIIFLVQDAPLSGYIKPVPLVSSLEANTTYQLKTGVISGWGYASPDYQQYSEVLLWSEVTVIPIEICKKFYPNSYDYRDKLCASNGKGGATNGDRGTGLHLRTPCGFKQIGMFNDYIQRNNTIPNLYTTVASFIDWINIVAVISN